MSLSCPGSAAGDPGRGARADRAFLARAVRFLVTEAGISQVLDIGTGIPSANNTHAPASRRPCGRA